MEAPTRMFVRCKPNGAMGRWHDATSLPETAAMTSDGNNPMCPYILATPEALAASPEVAQLVAEAEARGMERAAGLAEAAEDAEYDLLQWLECSKALTAAGFNMDGTAEVTAKLTAALSHIKRGKTNG